MNDRVVLKWPVAVDDRIHRIGSGEILHVACQSQSDQDAGCVMVWTIEPRPKRGEPAPVPTREVQVYGTGHPLPFFAKALGTAVAANGRLVWHLFELPPAVNGSVEENEKRAIG
jgi:hypothetical protein